jgi:serine/threonine protein kinase
MRFEVEAQSAARLNHQNVCTVYRVGSLSDGTPYLVMPFIRGPSLSQRLKAEGRLNPGEVRKVIRDVACGLAAAHKLGVVHRDVRPDNVLFEEDTGRHCLCDFGIAGVLETGEEVGPKITATGEVLGNPAYISPEQMEGESVTDRADVFSLGILAHQLLTGHPPPNEQAVRRGKRGPAVDLAPLEEYIGDVDPGLVDLLRRCLAWDPSHRPSAADIVRQIDEGRGAPAPLRPPIPGPAGTLFSKLMERRFFQIIGGYIAGSWIAMEVVIEIVGDEYRSSPFFRFVLTTAVFGFFAVNILAWFHGKKGRQSWPKSEKWMLGVVAVLWVVVCLVVGL